ncbi:MAG: hypothetical protein CL663_04715, partial [Bacteroidetes bacterium]|nr:hypothetical protein [Bacteroidota bacterium]
MELVIDAKVMLKQGVTVVKFPIQEIGYRYSKHKKSLVRGSWEGKEIISNVAKTFSAMGKYIPFEDKKEISYKNIEHKPRILDRRYCVAKNNFKK